MSIRVGITGQSGFIGSHLYNTLGLDPSRFDRIYFEDSYFEHSYKLREFVKKCDVIVHLAAMNRHEDPNVIYETNINLTKSLIKAIEDENVKPHIIFSSSIQEELDNLYGKSKRECRVLFENWASKVRGIFTGILIPNVFGEFSRPNYNTFIATFASKLIAGEEPVVNNNSNVKLIYVASLCKFIIKQIENTSISQVTAPHDFETTVKDVLDLFLTFEESYRKMGIIPDLTDINTVNLFNTYRSYIVPKCTNFKENVDERGAFVEIIKLHSGGQVSFSTTKPNVTRGNHYHTRKIERFAVIKGKAQIEMRKIGSEEVITLNLDGNTPSYVDIPVWYTHNITNIGEVELYTIFWINELYNPEDSDTYFEKV